jgi:beta-glucosidase
MHVFAPKVNIEDFSAKYQTTFAPKNPGKYVLNVEGCGHFEVYVNGEKKQMVHIWRTTPTSTIINAESGKKYEIEIRFAHVKTWNANIKIEIAKEYPIDYQSVISKLNGINKVIFVGGISPQLEGEEMPVNVEGFKGGDRTNIELPKVQRDFLKALKDAGKSVIFVNCSGSAIALEPETKTCEAIVQAWYLGQEGGTALAEILFGDVNPSGKLPVTFYKNTSQLPDFEDYSMKGRTYRYFNDPLFAFGYGKSYTSFEIGAGKLSKNGDNYVVSVPVKNVGKVSGIETIQVYIKDLSDSDGPRLSLRGFARVDLKPGEQKNAEIILTPESFEFFDIHISQMRIKPGDFEIYYGNSSNDKDLKKIPLTR